MVSPSAGVSGLRGLGSRLAYHFRTGVLTVRAGSHVALVSRVSGLACVRGLGSRVAGLDCDARACGIHKRGAAFKLTPCAAPRAGLQVRRATCRAIASCCHGCGLHCAGFFETMAAMLVNLRTISRGFRRSGRGSGLCLVPGLSRRVRLAPLLTNRARGNVSKRLICAANVILICGHDSRMTGFFEQIAKRQHVTMATPASRRCNAPRGFNPFAICEHFRGFPFTG